MSDAAEPPPLSRLSPLMEKFGRVLVRWRIPVRGATAVISLAAAIPASRLELDESLESFFSPSDPLLVAYSESREAFGGDEFVLVAFAEKNPTHADELDALTEFSSKLSAVQGVRAESTQ